MKKTKVYIIPFSHLDLSWLGVQEECLSRGNRIISEVIRIAKKREDFCFLLEDVVFVKYFIDTHPEKLEDLKKLIKEKKIEVGPKWAGIHQNIQSGEDLVRNTLYAKQFLHDKLRTDTKTIHLGDLPGYTPQYPQILSKSDVFYAIMTRGGPKSIPLYLWQSPDGSKILTWYALKGYPWGRNLRLHENINKNELQKEIREISSLTSAPILMHWGIDLILPTERLCENVKKWNKVSTVKMEIATPTQYFEKVKNTLDLPVLSGEIPPVWGSLDAQFPHIATLDIPATNTLLNAEKFATITYILGLSEYPAVQLRETWQKLLQAMDHNYDGQGATEGDKRKIEYHKMAIFVGEEILRNSLNLIAENVEVKQDAECTPVVVFNPLSWTRSDIAKAHITFHGSIEAFDIAKFRNVVLKDEGGKEIPFQYIDVREGVSRDVTILFYAREVPSIGYKTFYLTPSKRTPAYGKVCRIEEIEEKIDDFFPPRKETIVLENEYFTIHLNKLTGMINITDKRIKQIIVQGMRISAVEERMDNYWARGDVTGRLFGNSIDEIKIEENGPVRARVILKGKIKGSRIKQEIILYKDIPIIDLVNTIDWEGEQPLKVQQIFPLKIENPQINYGVPYGVNSFENIQPDSGPVRKDEIPESLWKQLRAIQKWIDVSNNFFGVTIASNYRFVEIDGSSIKFNLLRGTKSPFCRIIQEEKSKYIWMSPKGEYISKFSLSPHQGSWKKAKSYRKGWELVNPLICVSVNDPVSEKKFPPTNSFCNISADNVVISVLKKGERDDLPILRCYETEGKSTRIKVNFCKPLKALTQTNLLEKEVKSSEDLAAQIKKYEIKTLRLEI